MTSLAKSHLKRRCHKYILNGYTTCVFSNLVEWTKQYRPHVHFVYQTLISNPLPHNVLWKTEMDYFLWIPCSISFEWGSSSCKERETSKNYQITEGCEQMHAQWVTTLQAMNTIKMKVDSKPRSNKMCFVMHCNWKQSDSHWTNMQMLSECYARPGKCMYLMWPCAAIIYMYITCE